MDTTKLVNVMRKEYKLNKSKLSESNKQTIANQEDSTNFIYKNQEQTSQKQQQKYNQQSQKQQDDYFTSTQNSFLIAEKQISTVDQTKKNNNRTHLLNFFGKMSDEQKQSQKYQHRKKSFSQSIASSSNQTKSNFFQPSPSSMNRQTNKISFQKYIENNRTGVGDVYSLLSPTSIVAGGNFKPFRDIIQREHQSMIDSINDKSIRISDKIKYQLSHNSTQMKLINQQINQERQASFQKSIDMQQYTNHLISKSGLAKKIQMHNSTPYRSNTYDLTSGQSPVLLKLIPPINSNSIQELEDPHLQPSSEELHFHWEKVVNYTNLLKPEFREGATLVEYKHNFFLYGGLGFQLMNSIYSFSLREYQWRKIEVSGEHIPKIGRFGHTANIYKDEMLVFGGGADYNFNLKIRDVFNELWILNLETLKWKQARTTGDYVEPRRHHAACIVGNNYFVQGGIQSRENYISTLSMLQLDKGRWKTWNFKQDESGVAFHQILPIFKKHLKICAKKHLKMAASLNLKNKFQVKEEGIYSFGGKQGNEKIRGKLMILKLDQKDMPIEWIIPETLGQNPPARFQHSFFYNWQIKGVVLFGGRTDEANVIQSVFQDVWVLYLTNLMWVSVQVSGQSNRFRFSHAFTTIDERMFVFGGASDISYTDCELYLLEMDKTKARKMRSNPVRDMATRQASIERLDVEDGEAAYLDKIKVAQKRPSVVKTFLRPLTKEQLKVQQENYAISPSQLLNKQLTFYSSDCSPRSNSMTPRVRKDSTMSPRMRQDSMLIKNKSQSLFSQFVNM